MIEPIGDNIIVKVKIETEYKTTSGLVLIKSEKELAADRPDQATVIAVGNGRVLKDGSRQALDVKEGDRILFGKYSGSEVKLDGEEYLILREEDVLGILSSNKKK